MTAQETMGSTALWAVATNVLTVDRDWPVGGLTALDFTVRGSRISLVATHADNDYRVNKLTVQNCTIDVANPDNSNTEELRIYGVGGNPNIVENAETWTFRNNTTVSDANGLHTSLRNRWSKNYAPQDDSAYSLQLATSGST
jgi:hypothetical protein